MKTYFVYRIKVAGVLDQSWADWLGGVKLTVETLEDGSANTTLAGVAVDQSALFGILDRIRDFKLITISVKPREVQ